MENSYKVDKQKLDTLIEQMCEGFCHDSGEPGCFLDCTGCEIAATIITEQDNAMSRFIQETWAYLATAAAMLLLAGLCAFIFSVSIGVVTL